MPATYGKSRTPETTVLAAFRGKARLHGMQEVMGSSPISSTRKSRHGKHLEASTPEAISIFFRISSPSVNNSRY
jgi:hypothetical protein